MEPHKLAETTNQEVVGNNLLMARPRRAAVRGWSAAVGLGGVAAHDGEDVGWVETVGAGTQGAEFAEVVDVPVRGDGAQEDRRLVGVRVGEAVRDADWHREQTSGGEVGMFGARGEAHGSGDDEEGFVVLAVDVLGRPSGRRGQDVLGDPDAVAGVGAVFENPYADRTIQCHFTGDGSDQRSIHDQNLRAGRCGTESHNQMDLAVSWLWLLVQGVAWRGVEVSPRPADAASCRTEHGGEGGGVPTAIVLV